MPLRGRYWHSLPIRQSFCQSRKDKTAAVRRLNRTIIKQTGIAETLFDRCQILDQAPQYTFRRVAKHKRLIFNRWSARGRTRRTVSPFRRAPHAARRFAPVGRSIRASHKNKYFIDINLNRGRKTRKPSNHVFVWLIKIAFSPTARIERRRTGAAMPRSRTQTKIRRKIMDHPHDLPVGSAAKSPGAAAPNSRKLGLPILTGLVVASIDRKSVV